MKQASIAVHGLDLSYFTGKLEAYLRAKGIAYTLNEMSTRSFRDCARATGVLQMPQVECADGTWLTDTTLIIRHFESVTPEPAISPRDPIVRFVSRLLEDFGDESLWRPALYYRWAFADDARLMSGRIAQGMLRDVILPFFLRRRFIRWRQQFVYLRKDGVTPATRGSIEQLYLDTLAAMEVAFERQPFVLGARPSEADFGLFGAMFRHFFSDPTPAKIMRERAPRTLLWVARMWAIKPDDFANAPALHRIPECSLKLLRMAAETHLPYMAANAQALAARNKSVRFDDRGATFDVPVSPYRAWCFDELQSEFSNLDADEQKAVGQLLGAERALALLRQPRNTLSYQAPHLPIVPARADRVLDRNWR
jgi:glutathione S-transferase